MKQYLLVFRNEKNDGPPPSPEQMQATVQQWQSWISGVAKDGGFVGTNRLQSEGRTIRPDNIITDGPYVEAKEMIGGYLLVNAASLDEATAIAKGCPGLLYGGNVEIRSVMSINEDPLSPAFLTPKG